MTNAEKFKDIFGVSIYTVASICRGEYMACEFCKNDTCTAQWWNAEYKKSITKNGISYKSIIYKAQESKEIQEDLNKLRELNEPTTKNNSPKYCDRNICLKNEYNNVGCEDCEVTKSQESTTKNDLGVDCISRADARSLVAKIDRKYMFGMSGKAFQDLYKGIDDLPSATSQEPRGDAINREAVLKLQYRIDDSATLSTRDVVNVEDIQALPSVTPIRPKGHWKLVQRGKVIDVCCSNCGAARIKRYAYNYTIDELNKEDINECCGSAEMRYCPSCGSDNREVEE